jgi:hypothetical protein
MKHQSKNKSRDQRKTKVQEHPDITNHIPGIGSRHQLFGAIEPARIKQMLFDMMHMVFSHDHADNFTKEERTDYADFFFILNMDCDTEIQFEKHMSELKQ